MKASDLLERHLAAWREATRHPFLDGVREGTLSAGTFESWLAQDYLFVADLLAFQARLLARAPRPAQAVLAGGLVALEAELRWFEDKVAGLGLGLEVPRRSTTVAYRDLLTRLDSESYPVGLTALWALERAYLEAWKSASPGHQDCREFVEHWTTAEFAGYVSGLEEATDAALDEAPDEERQRAEAAFLQVARLERAFWEMAFSGGDE